MLILAALLSLPLIAGMAGSPTTVAAQIPGEKLVCEIRQGGIICYFKP